MTEMNRERLEILERFLRGPVPRRRFDLSQWINTGDAGIKPKKREIATEVFCGTSACAWGWCPFIPEFKDTGIVLELDDGEYYSEPAFEGFYGFYAAERFFNLPPVHEVCITAIQIPSAYLPDDEGFATEDCSIAEWLFSPIYYKKTTQPSLVANRIRELLDKGAPETVKVLS